MPEVTRNHPPLTTRRIELFDPDALSDAVQKGHFEHKQVRPGRFYGELRAGGRGGCLVSSGCYSQTLLARGEMPCDAVVIGTILEAYEDGYINGFRFGGRDLICYPAGSELEYLLAAQTRWAALQLPLDLLHRLGLEDGRLFESTQVLAAATPACAPIVKLLQTSLDLPADNGFAAIADVDWESLLSSQLRALWLDRYGGAWSPARPSYAERMRLLRRFEQSIRDRLDTPLRVPSICADLGIPQRTLEQFFRDQLGVSPRRYIELVRLNGAHRALLAGEAANDGIAAVARRFGLTQPGRFSGRYRSLFSKLPSATARLSGGAGTLQQPAYPPWGIRS